MSPSRARFIQSDPLLPFTHTYIDYFPCICGIPIPGTAASGAPTSTLGRRAARTLASRVRAAPSAIRSRPCTRTPTPAITWAATPRPAPVRPRMVSNPQTTDCVLAPEHLSRRSPWPVGTSSSTNIFWRHLNSRAQRSLARRVPLLSSFAGLLFAR